MANRKKWYALPEYSQRMTSDVDEYIAAWRRVAEPIERHLQMKCTGFDPGLMFTKGNPQGAGSVTVSIPLWFALDLSRKLAELSAEADALA